MSQRSEKKNQEQNFQDQRYNTPKENIVVRESSRKQEIQI